VSGTTRLIASANDALSGISQVQFFYDGVSIGTATSPPYQVNWNTRQVSKTNHTLTAVATDLAGNTTTSAPVTVRVA
jgi:hypothetical protein